MRGGAGRNTRSSSLGLSSLALGGAELSGSRKFAGTVGAQGHEGLIKAFGAREIAAGNTLPTVAPAQEVASTAVEPALA